MDSPADKLAKALEMFIDHYPMGINTFLDDAYRAGRIALAEYRAAPQQGWQPLETAEACGIADIDLATDYLRSLLDGIDSQQDALDKLMEVLRAADGLRNCQVHDDINAVVRRFYAAITAAKDDPAIADMLEKGA